MVDRTKLAKVGQVFTPGAPVNTIKLFAGRMEQVLDVMNAVSQRGQHVALYGERGVGKTSLANVLAAIYEDRDLPRINAVRVNCNTETTYRSLWARVFRDIGMSTTGPEWDGDYPDPEDVRYALDQIPGHTVIVLDEIDRLGHNEGLSLLADTIKTLSDHSVQATLLLVGVADSLDDLVGDHASVIRALTEVPMPRMSMDELTEIIDRGLEGLSMTINRRARARIARLSEGLPHYTHLLSLHATQRAVQDDREEVGETDVDAAIHMAVKKIGHTILSEYQLATRSTRATLFVQVLLACALAPKDDLGFFTTTGVRAALAQVMHKRYEIWAFAKHLNKLTGEGRGHALQKSGEPRRYFYRFADPLLQPFVILKGIADGLITEETVERFGSKMKIKTAGPNGLERRAEL